MTWPSFTTTDLSNFSGRPVSAYPAYSSSALSQSLLLFQLATCLPDWPTSDPDESLAQNAVLGLADMLVLQQPFQLQLYGSPFQSEGLASYNYTLKTVTNALKSGQETGNFWFDLAAKQLSQCDSSSAFNTLSVDGDSTTVFEDDALFGVDDMGHQTLLSPKDIEPFDIPGLYDYGILVDPDSLV